MNSRFYDSIAIAQPNSIRPSFNRESDNDNGKQYKYVCISTNQPDTKSNPNPNLTAKTECSGIHSTIYCLVLCVPRKTYDTMLLHCFYYFPLSLLLWLVFDDCDYHPSSFFLLLLLVLRCNSLILFTLSLHSLRNANKDYQCRSTVI